MHCGSKPFREALLLHNERLTRDARNCTGGLTKSEAFRHSRFSGGHRQFNASVPEKSVGKS